MGCPPADASRGCQPGRARLYVPAGTGSRLEVAGRPVQDRWAAWMRTTSPQGRVYGVSCTGLTGTSLARSRRCRPA